MSIQDIERLISELQKGQQELARRDREHDEHITIMLGQIVTLVPEVREMKNDLRTLRAEVKELDTRLTTRLDDVIGQLALVLQKLDEGKS